MNELDKMPLATELLYMLKQSAKRWFIAFIIMVILELATIGVFIWYITLPVEDTTYTQTVDDIEDSDVRQVIGGDLDGQSNTDSSQETESSTEKEKIDGK